MKITTADEMRTIDRVTSEQFGVPSLALMEHAGAAVARMATERWPQAQRIMVVCGKGNNGGDGFVAARKLAEEGRQVRVALLARPEDIRGDAAEMFPAVKRLVSTITSADELRVMLADCDLAIDAILGTGFRPPVTGIYAAAIDAINNAGRPVLAVDIPSGADADAMQHDDGNLVCRADAAVTFTAPRPAHIFGDLVNGPTRVVPIGSPEEAVQSGLGIHLITPPDVRKFVAPRAREGHKGTYGHALVVGGSVGKTGAAAMAGMSALRSGAGLATVATAKSALPMVAAFAAELMTEPLAESDAGTISVHTLDYGIMDALADGKTVLAIGPGITRHTETAQFVRTVVGRYRVPMVIDADGLNAFEGCADELNGSDRPLVLTPHPGEMSRLSGLSTRQIQSDRVHVARDFARAHGCVLVLKGHRTVVALPNGQVWINPTGNPGMASGGSGDVLTGIIAGLIAQHPDDVGGSAAAGVFLHGLAGDIARDRVGEHSLVATDILNCLPEAFQHSRELAKLDYVEFE